MVYLQVLGEREPLRLTFPNSILELNAFAGHSTGSILIQIDTMTRPTIPGTLDKMTTGDARGKSLIQFLKPPPSLPK